MTLAYPQTPHVVVCDLPHGPSMSLLVGCAAPRHSRSRGPAAIFVRRDPEASWEHVATATAHAAIGELVSFDDRFPPFAGDELQDASSALRVRMHARELFSLPPIDVELGQGAMMVGSELLAFGRAEQVGPAEWILSELWRGLRDTGGACGGHQPGEPVMLLDSACVSIPYDPSHVGEHWAVKAAAGGQNLAAIAPAWEGVLSGASGVPMQPGWLEGRPVARSRWIGRLGRPRASLPPSEPLEAWEEGPEGVRQIGLGGPGRWASKAPEMP